jgi:hypothetical protein
MKPDQSAEYLVIRWENSELYAVPAIHFNSIFALEVNSICLRQETQPAAIAVELGTHTCTMAVEWLKELGCGSGKKDLPVMLGLMKKNRFVRASLRDKAIQLQKEQNRDLSELPPEVLRRELGFSDQSLLCLSPTDSIIEALRCAIELGVPLFGVDLEDMADHDCKQIMVPDPGKSETVAEYVKRAGAYADCSRDEEVDGRRELAMAARLKGLMLKHPRVLFTCGLGHWVKIKSLIGDPSVKPSFMKDRVPCTEKEDFRRMVVHPLMAVRYMDLFPAMTLLYQETRHSPDTYAPAKIIRSDAARIFKDLIQKACKKRFMEGVAGDRMWEDLNSLSQFEKYLGDLCLVGHHPVPDIYITLKAAEEMGMSESFRSELAEKLMDFPWTDPLAFPECGVLAPPVDGKEDAATVHSGYVQKTVYVRSVPAPPPGHESCRFQYIWPRPQGNGRSPWAKSSSNFLPSFTWRPYDYLEAYLSLKAIEAARMTHRVRQAVPFEGSMLHGIDVKSTIRAYTRDEHRVYVSKLKDEYRPILKPLEHYPVVFLLDPEATTEGEWTSTQLLNSHVGHFIMDKRRYEQSVRGGNMLVAIGYGTRGGCRNRAGRTGDKHLGITIFQPPSFDYQQCARWAERTNYRRCPFQEDISMYSGGGLRRYYEQEHDIRFDRVSWASAMIMTALPFARETLAVVAPAEYRIDDSVYRRANKLGIEISKVGHGELPGAMLSKLSECYFVPVYNDIGVAEWMYDKDIEEEMCEPQTANRDLLPDWLLNYGRKL